MTPSVAFYQERFNHFAAQAKKLEEQIKLNGWLRVILIVLLFGVIYIGFSNPIFFWCILLLILSFGFLVQRQTRLSEHKQQALLLARLNEMESKSINYSSIEFPDGQQFSDPHHPFSNDLDLFGGGSVFQFINRCATPLGETKLASDLKNPSYTAEELLLRQAAIRELSQLIEFRQQVWATGKKINNTVFDKQLLTHALNSKPIISNNSLLTALMYIMPVIVFVSIMFTIYELRFLPLTLILLSVNMTIAGFQSKSISTLQAKLSRFREEMKNYATLFELLTQQQVASTLMLQHKAVALEAHAILNKFSKLINALETRLNLFAMFLGNGLFLYDFYIVKKIETWNQDHANEVDRWLDSLASWDALLSPSTLHFNSPNFSFAAYTNTMSIEMEQAGHLLIKDSSRVNNDFELGKPANLCLITGANMAGKSTFLRLIGVNYVLGRMGSPVCASRWSMPLISLRTGMRTTDSLQDHQSYFYAELFRLQDIMKELRQGKPMLILLDEILKGTNSTDKQSGSRALMKQLKDLNCLALIATHDIALGDLEGQFPGQIKNACFEGDIENDQLTFSYKLKYGIAQKANATFLMHKMGIIPRGID